MPDAALDEFNTDGPRVYQVIATGPGEWDKRKKRRRIMEIQPGDMVVCYSYTDGPIDVGMGLKMVTQNQVLLRLRKDEHEIDAVR